MKKIFKLLLVVCLMAVLFVDCTTLAKKAEKTTPKKFKIGFQDLGLNTKIFDARWANYQYMCAVAGGEAVQQLVELTPESFINGAEKQINAGCNGLVIWPISESILPKIATMCDKAGVYYVLNHRTIQDPEIRKLCESSPYYVGCVIEDEDNASYKMGKYVASLGKKNIALITEPISDTMSMTREKGIIRAAHETGMKIVATARGLSQASDVTKAVSSFIAAYPELDTVILTGLTTPGQVDGTISAIQQAGKTQKDITITACDFVDGAEEAMKAGWMSAVYGGQHVPNGVFCTAMLINAIHNGGRLTKKPLVETMGLTWAYKPKDYNDFWKYVAGDIPLFTAKEIKEKMLFSSNPSLTVDDLVKLTANFSLQDVVKRHKNLKPGVIKGYSYKGYTVK